MDKTSAADSYRFETRSGELAVSKTDDGFVLDFPARSLEDPEQPDKLTARVGETVGVTPKQIMLSGGSCLAEFDSEAIIRAMTPDMTGILALDQRGLIITARGDDCDFVSRFFCATRGHQ